MTIDLTVSVVQTDDELLELVPLKQADDTECTRTPILEDLALDKIIKLYEEGYDFLVAKSGGEVIGYAVGRVDETFGGDKLYSSYGIYVSPEHRCQGVGIALKYAQINLAKEKDCEEIWSTLATANKASVRVQQKAGFELQPRGDSYFVRLSLK